MSTTRHRTLSRLAAVGGGIAVVMAATTFPAVAAEGDVEVTNTETVKVYADATGQVESKRLYEQLALTGDGTVDLANPVETDGLRNLNGFSGFDVEEGAQQVDLEVDGQENIRSVSDFEEDLPIEVSVDYVLDGEPISPQSLVGESGELEVTYTIRNATEQLQEISYPDGRGGTVTEQAPVMMPMVGSLALTLPSTFRDIEPNGASAAGDGEGGTRLSYSMTLLAPLGSDTAELSYTAQVIDAVAPSATITMLPVNPLDNPTLSNAAKSYKGGADTGARLTEGASTIDANLLKLRDGASDLLAGLIKLRNGADQLSTGLQDEAAPGARRLADGAGELNDGLGRLDDGAGQLADGTEELRAGTGKLDEGAGRLNDGANRLADGNATAEAGAKKLSGGLQQIAAGLDQLGGVAGLGAAANGIDQLQAGVQAILNGFGSAAQAGTLLNGLTQLAGGLAQLEAGQTQVVGGLQQLTAPGGLPAAKGGVDQVKSGLDAATGSGGSLDTLKAGIGGFGNFCALLTDPALSQCQTLIAQLQAGVEQSRTQLQTASAGLGQVSTGLASAIGGLDTQLIPGAVQVRDGLTSAKNGANQALNGAQALRAGVAQVAAGLDQLEAGLAQALAGVFALANGADAAYAGSQELTGGLGQLADGSAELAAGTGDLVDGTGELDAGANKLADGAGRLKDGTSEAAAGSTLIANGAVELADGLLEAAGGSGLLAEGLATAAEGAPKLVDGAQRLSDEGTKKLVEAGEDTAQEYGKQYALVMAGAERAQDGKMIVGAPEDSIGLAAYSYEIRGEDGEGDRNLARALGGLALLGAGAGLFALRRRFV